MHCGVIYLFTHKHLTSPRITCCILHVACDIFAQIHVEKSERKALENTDTCCILKSQTSFVTTYCHVTHCAQTQLFVVASYNTKSVLGWFLYRGPAGNSGQMLFSNYHQSLVTSLKLHLKKCRFHAKVFFSQSALDSVEREQYKIHYINEGNISV